MDEGYRHYLLKKIESAASDYTSMSREDLCEYILFYVKCLLDEKED